MKPIRKTLVRTLSLGILAAIALGPVYPWWVPWFAPLGAGAQAGEAGMGLSGHVVAIEGRRIEGLGRNLSGLTFNEATGTLFATVNRPAAVVEIAPDGRVLRRLLLPAAWDAEGITHVEGDLFVIADEAGNLLHWLTIPPDGPAGVVRSLRLNLGWSAWPNLGFEGVSWDEARGELLLANEKWPRKVLRVGGLWPWRGATAVTVREWWPQRWALVPAGDLASLTTHEASGNLVLLSEQSRLVLEYSRAGVLVGSLGLRAGDGGLMRDIPQPEGIALGGGSLFIVSEPDLFYRFDLRRD